MSDQLTLGGVEPVRPRRGRVESLAATLAGFVAPGWDAWAKVPRPIRDACLRAAEEAIRTAQAEVDDYDRRRSHDDPTL